MYGIFLRTIPYVPRGWIEHIREHQEPLATMALDWEWDSCLTWSDRVFSMIDDGRLPWDDNYAINDWVAYIQAYPAAPRATAFSAANGHLLTINALTATI